MRCRLHEGRVARTSRKCRNGNREKNIVLEARSILCAVRDAESNYPQGRFLILSENLALVVALCKGRSTFFYIALSVKRRIFASGFRAGFVLSFR